jgi:hypothetical protein
VAVCAALAEMHWFAGKYFTFWKWATKFLRYVFSNACKMSQPTDKAHFTTSNPIKMGHHDQFFTQILTDQVIFGIILSGIGENPTELNGGR